MVYRVFFFFKEKMLAFEVKTYKLVSAQLNTGFTISIEPHIRHSFNSVNISHLSGLLRRCVCVCVCEIKYHQLKEYVYCF